MCEIIDYIQTLNDPVQQNTIALATGKNTAKHKCTTDEISQILQLRPQIISRMISSTIDELLEAENIDDLHSITKEMDPSMY